jgi:hypothetical protein
MRMLQCYAMLCDEVEDVDAAVSTLLARDKEGNPSAYR